MASDAGKVPIGTVLAVLKACGIPFQVVGSAYTLSDKDGRVWVVYLDPEVSRRMVSDLARKLKISRLFFYNPESIPKPKA